MARLVFTDMTAFTMGGTSYIADLRDFLENPGPVYADGTGFNTDVDKDVLVKLNHTIDFEVQMSNLGADNTDGADVDTDLEMTNLCVSAFSIDGTSRLAALRSATFNIERMTKEGSGLADLRGLPVSVKRKFSGSANLLIDTSEAEIPLVQNMSDQGTVSAIYGASSAFYVPLIFTITDPTGSAVFNYSSDVSISPKHHVAHDDLQQVDVDFNNRGAPTTATGSGIIATVMGSAQPLIDLVFTVGNLTTDTNTLTAGAFINKLTIGVQDAAIVSINGTLTLIAEPTFT